MIELHNTAHGSVFVDPFEVSLAMLTPIRGKGDSYTYVLGLKFKRDGGGMFSIHFDNEDAATKAFDAFEAYVD